MAGFQRRVMTTNEKWAVRPELDDHCNYGADG
jgi:hypothetical protein